MGRQFRDKIHVGQRKQRQKNGDIYILERTTKYDNAVIAYDSTTQSTYSENLHEARQGFNKDGDGLNTIKLLTLYSVKDREPIAFAKQPGNIPDVISTSNAITQLESLGIPRPLVVTDNGYYSQANMAEFAIRNQKFLTLVDTDVSWVREVIDSLEDELDGADGVCPFDNAICGATLTREKHKLSRTRKRARGVRTCLPISRYARKEGNSFQHATCHTKRSTGVRNGTFRLGGKMGGKIYDRIKTR